MEATPLTLNGLLETSGIDLREVVVFRHRPYEADLNKVFDWIVAERRDLFECYQDTHGPRAEAALTKARYVASFIRYRPKQALFVGLYQIDEKRSLSMDEYVARPLHRELMQHGMSGQTSSIGRDSVIEFSMSDTGWNADWSQKLIIEWPGLERSWYRWADRNTFKIKAIAEDALLLGKISSWEELSLDRSQISLLPASWCAAMSQWRGIYLINDRSDGKQYVGSAAGQENILQRWQDYSRTGHGGNKLLKLRDSANFTFSILQLVSPAMPREEVCEIESTWKKRLLSAAPNGLNEN